MKNSNHVTTDLFAQPCWQPGAAAADRNLDVDDSHKLVDMSTYDDLDDRHLVGSAEVRSVVWTMQWSCTGLLQLRRNLGSRP